MFDQLKIYTNSVLSWLQDQSVAKKMDSPLGWLIMAAVGVALAYATSIGEAVTAVIVCFCAVGVFIVILCLKKPMWGYYMVILISTFISLPDRLVHIPLPLGLLIEVLSYVVFFGVLAKQYRERINVGEFWRNPISVILIIQYSYFLIEAFNPETQSLFGWSLFFRKQLSFLMFYYITYLLLDNEKKIFDFLAVWVGISLFIALWGIKQQWLGFFEFEERWIYADAQRVNLFFQTGFMRKFSILTDPAGFGVCMSSTGVFTLILGIRSNHKRNRILLIIAGILILLSSSYSGTRTANLMIAAGIAAYGIFTINEKRTAALIIAFVFFTGALLFGPFQNNPVVFRMKSTLEGNKDASANIRDYNRHNVQPYIWSHPLGGGINTTGAEGQNYNPSHYLANYPPDSGYMKILAEQGWLGYAIHMLFYFIVLKAGLEGFYKAKRPEIKNAYIAITVFLFILLVGEISQITNGGYPYSYFYYPLLVIIYKLIDYDTPTPEKSNI